MNNQNTQDRLASCSTSGYTMETGMLVKLASGGSKEVEARFEDFIDEYMESKIGGYASSTIAEQYRKMTMFGKRLEALKKTGRIETTDPHYMGEKEVRWFIQDMKDRGLDVSTQKKYIEMLNNMLQHFGNTSADRVRRQIRLEEPIKPVETLSRDQCIEIIDYIDKLEGWRGSVTRGLIYLAFQTWARPGELYNARLIDLDLTSQTFFIKNPKGKGTFASLTKVDLTMKGSIYLLERYLNERAAYLASKNVDSPWLFPHVENGTSHPYAHQTIDRMVASVSDALGFHFSLKTFRATMTYLTISADPMQLPNASRQLRHNSLETTERYYEGLARDNVGERMRPVMDKIDFMRRIRVSDPVHPPNPIQAEA